MNELFAKGLFCAFIVFLIFFNRTTEPVQEEPTSSAMETVTMEDELSGPVTVMTEEAESVSEDMTEKPSAELLEKKKRTLSFEELETENPEETMTAASVIAEGIIKNGKLTIDVSAVENDLRKGELYSLADTITRYMAELEGKVVEGEVQILYCKTKETANQKTQIVVFQRGKQKYKAVKDLAQETSEYTVSEYDETEITEKTK